MKLDMHCHTKEGSIDARVGIEDYIKKLIENGFDGMLVTDHNSYKGYQAWRRKLKDSQKFRNFTVLKGIEYDTLDGGHFIAILPDGVHSKLLTIRGMTTKNLEKLVHGLGGILGPAHPFGTGYFAFMNRRLSVKNEKILSKFDFIETFNSCVKPWANQKASELAKKYKKPAISGSDAHFEHVIGSAYTQFRDRIKNNNDLINAIKREQVQIAGGDLLEWAVRKKNKLLVQLGIMGYYLYNSAGALFFLPRRKKELKKNNTWGRGKCTVFYKKRA